MSAPQINVPKSTVQKQITTYCTHIGTEAEGTSRLAANRVESARASCTGSSREDIGAEAARDTGDGSHRIAEPAFCLRLSGFARATAAAAAAAQAPGGAERHSTAPTTSYYFRITAFPNVLARVRVRQLLLGGAAAALLVPSRKQLTAAAASLSRSASALLPEVHAEAERASRGLRLPDE